MKKISIQIAIIITLILIIKSTELGAQWALPGNATHSTSDPEIQRSNPKLILDNTSNGIAGIQFNNGFTIDATFGYNENTNYFNLTGTSVSGLYLDGNLFIDNKLAISEHSATFLQFGAASTGVSNYFPSRVGIGTTNIGSTIDLGIDGGATTNVELTATSENKITFDQGTNTGYLRMIGDLYEFRNTTGDFEFTKSNLDPAFMVIKTGGNVGIGTETPTNKLEVNGIVNISGDSNTALRIDGKEAIWWEPTSDRISWGFGGEYNYFADEVRIGGSGSGAPGYQLEVVGNADITGELTAASDKRLKKNIKDIDNALTLINGLRPKIYNFRVDEFPEMHLAEGDKMGFLAQELEKVLPELVSTGGEVTSSDAVSFNSKSVNYIELIPLLTKAIQEQQLIIEQQQQLLSKYQDGLSQLALRVSTLESKDQKVSDEVVVTEEN